MDPILGFVIFWGVWVLFPFIIDGAQVIFQAFGVLISRRLLKRPRIAFHIAEQLLPTVSVIIPTYNEERNIDQCLNSLKIQSYPHEKMEIIVVDDGSTDRTNEHVSHHLGGSAYFESEMDGPLDDAAAPPAENDLHRVRPADAGNLSTGPDQIINLEELSGRPVVAYNEGKKLGLISDVLVDLEAQQVVALLVTNGEETLPELLAYRQAWIGNRSILVEKDKIEAESLEIPPERACLGKALSHLEILSPSGEPLGQIEACRIHRESGTILDYLITGHEVEELLTPQDIAAFSSDGLYVRGGVLGTDEGSLPIIEKAAELSPAQTAEEPAPWSTQASLLESEDGFAEPRSNGHKNGNGHSKVRIKDQSYEIRGFGGAIRLLSPGHQGKAHALNLGIENAHGDIVFTLDSDVMLAPRAIQEIVSLFLADSGLGAATGTIEISPEIVEEIDDRGQPVTDEAGEFKPKKLSPTESFLSTCQFLEYLSAFHIGRQHQASTNTLYTLAGAFSAFRRDILLKTGGYSSSTVSEDTDLTMEIHRQGMRLGYAPEAKAIIKPVLSWGDLYAQRVRWMRGQLEVCAAHSDMVGGKYGLLGRLALPRMLLMDHTLAFPRVVWTMMLPLLVLFGYSAHVVTVALALMYMFYVGIEFFVALACYAVADQEAREEILDNLHYCFAMPVYRFVTFYFRLSGYLRALNDPPEWRVSDPLTSLRFGARDLAVKTAAMIATLSAASATWPLRLSLALKTGFSVAAFSSLESSLVVGPLLHRLLRIIGLGLLRTIVALLAVGVAFWLWDKTGWASPF